VSHSRWQRLEALFDGALDLPEEERDPWLHARCGDDPGLLREVQSMLAAAAREGGILDQQVMTAPESPEVVLRTALAGRYVLDRELGRGGMATVFLAHEQKHDRAVVLKVLKPDVARLYGRERFLREVQIAARLAHPHILGLIDSGEAGGLLFYVMPFVEGETLRDRLRGGPLPLPEAVALLRDIAHALAYAHRAGVVHRDLKPDNVLCVAGHAFLMDFGVAKLAEERDPMMTGGLTMTGEGVAIGTPAYMAPEQAAGRPEVGSPVDVYAWGLLAYECVTGQSMYQHAASAMIAAEFGITHPNLPRPLADVIRACLEESPGERPDADELVRQLDQLARQASGEGPAGPARRRARAKWLVVSGVVAATALAWLAFPRPPERLPLPVPVAVTVLENETGDSTLAIWGRLAGDWLTQGLQEAGIVPVVAWPTARQAAERASGRGASRITAMRAETGAGTIVTGSYYLVGDRVRFQATVVDAVTGAPLVSPSPVEASRDSVELAVRLLRERVLGAIAVQADERFRTIPGLTGRPPTFEAYRAADRGLELYNDQQYRASIPEFARAFDLDSTFTAVLVPLAFAYWNTSQFARLDSALRSVRQRHLSLSPYHEHQVQQLEAMLAGDGEAALRAIRRAYDLSPAGRAGYNVAVLELRLNRPRDALRTLQQLDPNSGALLGWSSYWTQLAHAHHLLGDHALELAAAREMRTRFPDRRVALALETRALAAAGLAAEVDSVLVRGASQNPDTYWSPGAAMVIAGEEFLAHDRLAEGQAVLNRAVSWFANQLARTPDHEDHRYWLGLALYNLGAWSDAAPYFRSLTRDFPDRLVYRGLTALTAARRGQRQAETLLGPPPSHNRGEYLTFRARIAAVQGNVDHAFSLFAEAFRSGFEGFPWIHATAVRDLEPLRADPRYASIFGI
jgi:tetratricopeptide (TPR) repeat protein